MIGFMTKKKYLLTENLFPSH
ncbi:hypothetical protein LMQOC1_30290 [Listeria monocytogenes QOC1]|nr:hypothetical protein LMQOC1_30290 [Listeria monocytogenes QOC1]